MSEVAEADAPADRRARAIDAAAPQPTPATDEVSQETSLGVMVRRAHEGIGRYFIAILESDREHDDKALPHLAEIYTITDRTIGSAVRAHIAMALKRRIRIDPAIYDPLRAVLAKDGLKMADEISARSDQCVFTPIVWAFVPADTITAEIKRKIGSKVSRLAGALALAASAEPKVTPENFIKFIERAGSPWRAYETWQKMLPTGDNLDSVPDEGEEPDGGDTGDGGQSDEPIGAGTDRSLLGQFLGIYDIADGNPTVIETLGAVDEPDIRAVIEQLRVARRETLPTA